LRFGVSSVCVNVTFAAFCTARVSALSSDDACRITSDMQRWHIKWRCKTMQYTCVHITSTLLNLLMREMDVLERVAVSTHSGKCIFRVRCINDCQSAAVTSAMRAAKEIVFRRLAADMALSQHMKRMCDPCRLPAKLFDGWLFPLDK